MIPTMVLVGLLLGRWWWQAVIGGALAWPTLLLIEGVIAEGEVLTAAGLGALNTAGGVLVHQLLLRGLRALWSRRRPAAP
ncbi:hypothetical protein [Ornithinicoccus halotolerans]|uniref:hypothetical protein n=1 Tax=Ornithinicoccus halotolerans TaxID=1748220 RepID=UPI0012956CC6|nr:hypothetical protein [Ornithinicoccus halotolerans]